VVYKQPGLSKEFSEAHPKSRLLVESVDEFVRREGWPDVMITAVFRTPSQQEAFYWKQVQETLRCTEKIAREIARAKPSWHLWRTGIDFSSKRYDRQQAQRILEYLKSGRQGLEWEILHHDIGAGEHFHVAFKDREWKARWSQALVA
jgi:hypothetical protein